MKRRRGAQLVFMSCVSTGSPGEKSSDQVAGAIGRRVEKVAQKGRVHGSTWGRQPENDRGGGSSAIDYRLVPLELLLPRTLGIRNSKGGSARELRGRKCSVGKLDQGYSDWGPRSDDS